MGYKKTHITYESELDRLCPTIKVIEKYILDNVKIQHKCLVCGHTWKAKPSNVLHGKGCPVCGHHVI